MAALFDLSIAGPAPGTATTPAEQWIDLGTIPTGSKFWVGSMTYTAAGKTIAFDLRTNLAGLAAGTLAATKSLGLVSCAARKSVTLDLYKNSLLHTATVVGTGVEKWWLRLTAKSATATTYTYVTRHTTE